MQETVEFKMDVSDENIKRNVMKVVWMFSGVTYVDIKEKGQLKVRGNFDKYEMGPLLHEIDNSVDIIKPMQKPAQYHIPIISSVSTYFNAPKVEEIVIFEFKILDEHIKPEAMEVIWEFSGISSVEVEENRRVKVMGAEFNKLDMLTKLQKIDESVTISSYGQDVEAKPEVKQSLNNGSSNWTNLSKFNLLGNKKSDASSSKAPTPAVPKYGAAGAGARARAAAEKAKAETPVNKWLINPAIEILKVPVKAGFRALANPLTPMQQLDQQIKKQKADKLRIEKENAEKQEKARKLRIKKEKEEKYKAEKLRIEKEKEEKLRIEKEKAKTEGKKTQTQTESWFTGATSKGTTYLTTLLNPSDQSIQYQSSTKKPRKESQ